MSESAPRGEVHGWVEVDALLGLLLVTVVALPLATESMRAGDAAERTARRHGVERELVDVRRALEIDRESESVRLGSLTVGEARPRGVGRWRGRRVGLHWWRVGELVLVEVEWGSTPRVRTWRAFVR